MNCKDQDGNLMTDIKSSLDLLRVHFNAILNGDDTNNPANESYDGLSAELFKAGGDELVSCMTNFSATYGHWKACQVIGVLV